MDERYFILPKPDQYGNPIQTAVVGIWYLAEKKGTLKLPERSAKRGAVCLLGEEAVRRNSRRRFQNGPRLRGRL